jgi:glutathione S-transferase
MIEIWGRSNAYNVQKVLWMLAELGLESKHYDLGSNPGDLESSDYLAINPHARIPTLRDDNGIAWESNTIVRYLASEYGGESFASKNAMARSSAERWMDWELCKLQPDFIDLFWGYYRKLPAERDQQAINLSLQNCQAHYCMLDDHLQQHRFLAGDAFGIADIPCATSLYRYFNMGLEVERPQNLIRWYESLLQRPAFQQTIAVAFDELQGRANF